MCDCRRKVLEKVAEHKKIDVAQVKHKNYFLFGDKHFVEAEITINWKTKAGKDKQTKSQFTLVGEYCMFCGEKYPVESSKQGIELEQNPFGTPPSTLS